MQNLAALQKRAEAGENVPLLKRMPRPDPAFMWVWQAYEVLAAKRFRFNGVPQPIQTSEIAAYADYLGVSGEFLRGLLFHVISVLDLVYLSDWHSRQKK